MSVIPFPRSPYPDQQPPGRRDRVVERLAARAMSEAPEREPVLAEAQAERDRSAARGQWDRAQRLDAQLRLARHADDRGHLRGEGQVVAGGDRDRAGQARAHLEVLAEDLARDQRHDPALERDDLDLDALDLDDPEWDEECER